MAQVLVTEEYLEDTADAIRAKLNTERSFTPAQMADGVREIHGDPILGTKSVATNGTYNAETDDLEGFSSVTVDVPNTYTAGDEGKVVSSGALVAQTSREITVNGTVDTTTNNAVSVNVRPNLGTKSITANGTYSAASDNVDGFSSVEVNVQGGGGGGTGTLIQKEIKGNGTYTATDDGADGYSTVTVNVPATKQTLDYIWDSPDALLYPNDNLVCTATSSPYVTHIYDCENIDVLFVDLQKSSSGATRCWWADELPEQWSAGYQIPYNEKYIYKGVESVTDTFTKKGRYFGIYTGTRAQLVSLEITGYGGEIKSDSGWYSKALVPTVEMSELKFFSTFSEVIE